MIPTLKDKILATDPAVWQSKVARHLRFYWDEKSMEDLPRRFKLVWEEIEGAQQVYYQHNILVDFVAYHCFLGERMELTKRFVVFDEDMLIEDFKEIPEFEGIKLEPWEEAGERIDDLSHLDVVRLLLSQQDMLEPETSDLHNLALYLGARVPAYTKYRQERTIVAFLAMVLDEYSGRVAMLPEPCETDKEFELKWGHLYSQISEYRALKRLRDEIVLNDV